MLETLLWTVVLLGYAEPSEWFVGRLKARIVGAPTQTVLTDMREVPCGVLVYREQRLHDPDGTVKAGGKVWGEAPRHLEPLEFCHNAFSGWVRARTARGVEIIHRGPYQLSGRPK